MLRQYRRRPTDGAVEVRRRCLGRVNVDEFNVILYCTDWNEVWTCETAAESWDAFCRVFLAALDTVAPLRRVRLPPQRAPPLTAATRDLFACRRRALDDRSAAGRERYKDLNRRCRAAVRADTVAHLERECQKAGPARMWRVLRPIIGDRKGAQSSVLATPDALNLYFSQIGQTVAQV